MLIRISTAMIAQVSRSSPIDFTNLVVGGMFPAGLVFLGAPMMIERKQHSPRVASSRS